MLNGISKSLIDAVTNVLSEKKSGDKEAYQKFFDKALKKYGVKSPDELSTEKKKEFFNYVDKNWKGDDEQQKEELEKDSDDPCWKGYVQVGTKKKDGKEVPNCVPKEEAVKEEADLEEARRRRRLSADEKKAFELGKKASKAGKERVAMMGDKELQKLGGSTSVGLDISTPKGKKLAKAWFDGWDTANFDFTELLGDTVKEEADDDDDDENEIDEKKMTAAAKRKAAKYRQKNKQSLKKYRKKYNRDINRGTRKVNKQRSKSMRKSRAKSGFSEDVELDEKAVSQSQQKLMGMAYALKKGDMDSGEASAEVQRIADTMSLSDLKDFASTEHDDLPLKKESTEIQESSDDDMKDLAREIDDIDEIPNSIKQSLKNGELPSKRDVQTIDSEWAQDALLVSLSELLGAKNVEKMYGMKVINPDAL